MDAYDALTRPTEPQYWDASRADNGYTLAGVLNPKLNAYTVLCIANKDLTCAELVAAGADPSTTPATGVQMDAGGTVIWEWCLFDQRQCSRAPQAA